MFLIMLLLFPTTPLSVFANTLENTETMTTLEPTAYYALDGDFTDKTGNNETGVPFRRFEEDVSDWGEVRDYTFEFHQEGRNQAVYFDGTTGVKLADNLITSDTYSYSLWLKQTGEIGDFTSALFTGVVGRRAGISPAIGDNGELLYQVEDAQAGETGLPVDYQFVSLSDSHQPYEWNNFVVTVDQGDLSLYLNGAQVAELANVLNIYEDLDSEYLLGFNPFPDPYYVGYMDEVMFFDDQALTAEQVEGYYHSVVDDFRLEEEPDEDDTEDPVEEPEEGESGGDQAEDQDQQPSDEVITNDIVPSLPEKPLVPDFKNVSVHDPSIITADGKFYAFGTHIDSARSDDLINWESFTNGYTTPGNALYGDLSANLAEAFKWAGEDDSDSKGGFAVWAPEVFFNPDYKWNDGTTGAYMIYYSASSTYIRSVIGFAIAKDIEGPYEHVDTLIYSGFTDHEAYDSDSTVNKHWENTNIKQLIDDGVIDGPRSGWFNKGGGYNNSTFTNAIDANLFYDEEGRLWMTYGSWSGGIFILEVNKETGHVIYPGQDGKTSDGRLIDRYFGTKISGGYTKSGEGPYVEYNSEDDYYYLYVTYGWLGADGGYHMRQFRSENPDGPYLDRAGEPAVLPADVSNEGYGNKLAGNFLFKRESGDPGTGEGYGYVSPGHNSIYTDKETNQQFNVFHTRFPNRGEVHELRIHQMFTNQDGWRIMAPLRYAGETLDESITNDEIIGSYKYINHGKTNSERIVESKLIDLHADGTISGAVTGTWERDGYYTTLTIDGQTYDGVFVEMWDEVSQMWLMTFTALSDQGISVWGIQHPMKASTDEEIVEMVAGAIELPSSTFTNLHLPTNGSKGTTINWKSSNANIIDSTGAVTRPAVGNSEQMVRLTAEITLNNAILSKTYDVTIIPYQEPELRAHYRFDGDLSDETGQFEDAVLVGDRPDKIGEGNLVFEAGRFGDALYLDGSSGALLPDDLLVDDHFSIGFWFNPEEIHQFGPSLFVMQDDENWFTVNPKGWNDEILLWSKVNQPRETWFDGITGTSAKVGEWHHVAITNEYGRVRIYVDGERVATANNFNQVVNGDALTIALGVNPFDSAFKGYFDDLVIYQAYTLSNQEVESLYQGQIPEVNEKEEEVATAHFTFDEDLSDVIGNFSNATVTGNRIDNTGGEISFEQTGIKQAIYFDGQSGVNLGTGLITSYEYSVSFWLKPEELRDYTTSFFGTHPVTGWTSFLPGGSHEGGVTKLWSGEDWYDANLDFLVELNEWSHISYTVDNGDLRIYVNGELEFSGKDFPNVFVNDQAVFSLGVNYWDSPYKGYIDELIIHDAHVLSAEDVENYYLETYPLIDQDTDDEGNTTEPEIEDQVIIEDFEEDFREHSESNAGKVYVAKKTAKAYVFKKEALQGLDDTAQIEVTDGNVRVRIPVEIIRESGQSEVRFEMNDVTDDLKGQIDSKEKRLSELISFSLKDENGDAIEFDSIDLYFEIDLDKVDNIDNLSVIYFNNEGEEDTDHDAKIIDVNKVTGEVIVRVRHFSTYGIVELLDDSDVDDQEPDLPDYQDDQGTNDGSDSGENDQGANDGSDSGEGDQGTDDGSDSGEGNQGSDDSSDSGEDNQDSDVTPDTDGEDDGSGDEQVETDQDAESDDEGEQSLPKTATNLYNMILLGFMFVLIGGGMFIFRKRKFES